MSNLINDILIKAGVIKSISRGGAQPIEWFKEITVADIFVTYILPLLFFLGLSTYLKIRYTKKKARDEITLRPFLNTGAGVF